MRPPLISSLVRRSTATRVRNHVLGQRLFSPAANANVDTGQRIAADAEQTAVNTADAVKNASATAANTLDTTAQATKLSAGILSKLGKPPLVYVMVAFAVAAIAGAILLLFSKSSKNSAESSGSFRSSFHSCSGGKSKHHGGSSDGSGKKRK